MYGRNLLPLLDSAYGRFARWRFQRRCREGVCAVSAAAVKGSVQQPEKKHLVCPDVVKEIYMNVKKYVDRI
jgi:succinate dehydrogenase/fumarate reductase-like Fe-S protein